MRPIHTFRVSTVALAAAICSTTTVSADFAETSEHLDLDGSIVGYINFEGDGAEIGATLNGIYEKVIAAGGEIPPIPVDFQLLFENLGFGSLKGVGMSSKQVSDDLHINRWVAEMSGDPAGFFAMYGNSEWEEMPFTAAAMVPADANLAGCGPIDLTTIIDTARVVMTQFMGPIGEGMTDQYLSMPIPGTEITASDLIVGLSGRWDYAYKLSFADIENPEIDFWVQVEGNGQLVEKLASLAETMPVAVDKTDSGETILDFSALMGPDSPVGLYIKSSAEGNLIVYSNPNWGGSSNGNLLKDDKLFIELTKNLPETALWYSYSGGFDMVEMMAEPLAIDPNTALYADAILEATDFLIGDFYKPSAAASYYEGDLLISEHYAGYSTKQVVMFVPAVMSIYPAMAIPAFQKVRQTSQEKAVTNNLRMIASAADQYFLETGETKVKVDQLIGSDSYIRSLDPVAGESYEGMVISIEMDELSVTLSDGRVISLPY